MRRKGIVSRKLLQNFVDCSSKDSSASLGFVYIALKRSLEGSKCILSQFLNGIEKRNVTFSRKNKSISYFPFKFPKLLDKIHFAMKLCTLILCTVSHINYEAETL